jgi:hypothetical protein
MCVRHSINSEIRNLKSGMFLLWLFKIIVVRIFVSSNRNYLLHHFNFHLRKILIPTAVRPFLQTCEMQMSQIAFVSRHVTMYGARLLYSTDPPCLSLHNDKRWPPSMLKLQGAILDLPCAPPHDDNRCLVQRWSWSTFYWLTFCVSLLKCFIRKICSTVHTKKHEMILFIYQYPFKILL